MRQIPVCRHHAQHVKTCSTARTTVSPGSSARRSSFVRLCVPESRFVSSSQPALGPAVTQSGGQDGVTAPPRPAGALCRHNGFISSRWQPLTPWPACPRPPSIAIVSRCGSALSPIRRRAYRDKLSNPEPSLRTAPTGFARRRQFETSHHLVIRHLSDQIHEIRLWAGRHRPTGS